MRRGTFTAKEAAALTGINYYILLRDIKKYRLRVPVRARYGAPFRISPAWLLVYYDMRLQYHRGGMSINPDAEAVFKAIQRAMISGVVSKYPKLFGAEAEKYL